MVGLVSENLDRIRAACARRGVSFLELVGSASRDDFDATRSDIDVLVDFPDHTPDVFGAYMGLREDLAEILGRPVDVITLRGIRNPLFLESLRRDAVRLYAA
jgi:predicted nucleotidyltransferase